MSASRFMRWRKHAELLNQRKKEGAMRKRENGKVKTLKSHKSIRISEWSPFRQEASRTEPSRRKEKLPAVTFDLPLPAHSEFGSRLHSARVCEYFPLVSDSIKWNFKFEMDTTCERMCVSIPPSISTICSRFARTESETNIRTENGPSIPFEKRKSVRFVIL